MYITRRIKVVLVTAFSLFLVAIFVAAGLSVASGVNWWRAGLANSTVLNGIDFGVFNQLYEKRIDQTFKVTPAQAIVFSASIGDVTVSEGTGDQVEVVASAGFGGFNLASAKQQADSYQLQATRTPNQLQLSLGNASGLNALHKVSIQLVVPIHAAMRVTSDMGNVNVNGSFKVIQVQDNMGNISVIGNVTSSTTLDDEMGNIFYQGDPGQSSNITNNMGNVTVVLTGTRPLQVDATTDLGNVSGALSVVTAQTAHHLSGAIAGGQGKGQAGIVTVVNNLGNINISEVKNG